MSVWWEGGRDHQMGTKIVDSFSKASQKAQHSHPCGQKGRAGINV